MMKHVYLLLFCCVVLLSVTGCPVLPSESYVRANDSVDRPIEEFLEAEGEGVPEGVVDDPGANTDIDIDNDYDLAYMEEDIIELINYEREQAGLSSLKLYAPGTPVARDHSIDMADRQYFDHVSPESKTARNRLDDAGIPWRTYGENIAYTYGYADPADAAVEGWMNSSGHRANIMDSRYTHTGVGIARDSKGAYFFTQIFLRF